MNPEAILEKHSMTRYVRLVVFLLFALLIVAPVMILSGVCEGLSNLLDALSERLMHIGEIISGRKP